MIQTILIINLLLFGLISCKKASITEPEKGLAKEPFYTEKKHDSVLLDLDGPNLMNKIKEQTLIFDSIFCDTLDIDYNKDLEIDIRFV